MKRKTLLIDANAVIAHCLSGYPSGIGRSTFELLTALSKIGSLPFDVVLYTQNCRRKRTKGLLPFEELHICLPLRDATKKLVNSLHLKQMLTHYDLCHIPSNTDFCESLPKTVFTIHDLMAYRYPEMWHITPQEKEFHRKVARGARAFITCSECSKADIVNFWNVPECKVISIPWGVNREIFHYVDGKSFCESHGIGDLFYFSASCNHPRKNALLMMEAFDRYVTLGGVGQLVLLNPPEAGIEKYRHLVEQRRLIAVQKISDSDLAELYSQAHCSIVASSFEGFGLPVIESLSCGTQVLCAHNSSLTEAGGEVVNYLKELSADELCSKLLECDGIGKESLLNRDSARRHLAEFTWERCAEKYVGVYENLLYGGGLR